MAQLKDGISYVLLLDTDLTTLQKRGAQLSIVGSGFDILAAEEADLSETKPLPVTAEIIGELEKFIAEYMAKFGIPGAAVGIVQDGEVVYAKGFGVADPETGAPMTPDTQMMIGSTGKSLSTLLMATLVDDGLMSWDTPVVDLYPAFRVQDPELSKRITMRNLVCACTGVPRRDAEMLFNAGENSAEDTVASLADFEFFTDFGEAFQYSNQMVATAGYIAGAVAAPDKPDLASAYAEALQARVLDPIGMEDTTISFADVLARGNHGTPHTLQLDYTYAPMPLALEEILVPVAPAGAHWSTLTDMLKYLQMQLADGVAPDGTRVVSAANLNETRQPQIAVTADTSYGLGWLVGDYKGQPVISHGGNTLGFTAGFTFLPEADLGVVVLANAQAANFLNDGVAGRLLELVYRPGAEDAGVAGLLPGTDREADEGVAGADRQRWMKRPSTPYLGRFHNDALGEITLSLEEGKLIPRRWRVSQRAAAQAGRRRRAGGLHPDGAAVPGGGLQVQGRCRGQSHHCAGVRGRRVHVRTGEVRCGKQRRGRRHGHAHRHDRPVRNDLRGMVAFYRDVLGFAIDWDGNGPYAEFRHEGVRFSMYERAQLPGLLGQAPTFPSGLNGTLRAGHRSADLG